MTKPRTKRRLSDVHDKPRSKRRISTRDASTRKDEGSIAIDSSDRFVTSPVVSPPVTLPEPSDSIFGQPNLPEWVTKFRPHQWQAAEELVDSFASGTDVMFCDAPTGSGKTLIAELVRRLLEVKALYVCSGKSLQDQFAHDFDYSHVLKGRSNYPTQLKPFPFVSCADCTKTPPNFKCEWCTDVKRCEYEVAKSEALTSQLAVINTSYLLTEANYIGDFSEQDFVIADECDLLEGELMNFVEFAVSDRLCDSLGLTPPKKGVHKETISTWILEDLIPGLKQGIQDASRTPMEQIKKIRRMNSLAHMREDAIRITNEVLDDNWVRDNDAGPLVLKPVKVHEYGRRDLWVHGSQWLCMSATIVSSDEMADSLGVNLPTVDVDGVVTSDGLDYGTVQVPMTFPLHHRRVILSNVGSMSRKNEDETFPSMVDSIVSILEHHRSDNVLIHTHSYKLNNALTDALKATNMARPILTYQRAADRENVLTKFKQTPMAVLLAPSMDRGIDLAGDTCRVIIIAKVPFPYLGDKQVSARLHVQGGQTWYNVQTVRTLVQMTGRAVRSEDDWCTTYILDGEFMKFYKKGKKLLPEWWLDSIKVVPPRHLREGRYEMSGP